MSPGQRAIDDIISCYEAERLQEELRLGADPIDAMKQVWGKEEDLRFRVHHSALDEPYRRQCLLALDIRDARCAAYVTPGSSSPPPMAFSVHHGPYRSIVVSEAPQTVSWWQRWGWRFRKLFG